MAAHLFFPAGVLTFMAKASPEKKSRRGKEGGNLGAVRKSEGHGSPLPRVVPFSSIRSISEALGADASPKEILGLIVQAAHSITRASTASLMLIEPGTDCLRVEVAEGFKDRRIFKTRLRVGQGVTGWVAETGEPLRLGNVTKDARYVRVQRGLRSELAVPLKIRGRVIGVISCDSTRLNHFSPEDEDLLRSLAAQSARVIHTTQLYQESQRRTKELSLLIEAGQSLGQSLDVEQVLTKLVELSAKFWRASVAAVFLADDEGEQLRLAAAYGGSDAIRALQPVPAQGTLLGKLIGGTGEVLRVDDPAAQWGDASGEVLRAEGLAKLLAAPLAAKGHVLGVLCLFGGAKQVFDDDQRRLLAGLARTAAMALENARVHRRVLKTEEALRKAEKLSLLVELAAGLAHEIRNPLTSVKILVESLAKHTDLADEAGDDVSMIRRQVERLESIVEEYLASARAHASAPRRDPVSLNAVVSEALLLLAGAADEGTRLVSEQPDDELMVYGDATQLNQAVYNLVLNAIQALAQAAREEKRGRGTVAVRTGREGARIVFEVADDGPGIAPEVKQRLFQPFVSNKQKGVGLGLTIVKRIVEAHDGTLEVESPRQDLGRGARFRVLLPAAE